MGRRKKDVSYTYKGVIYQTLGELAKGYNIGVKVLSLRLYRGFTLEQSLDEEFKSKYGYRRRGNTVKFQGVEYASLSHVAKAFNISPVILRRRLAMGYSLKSAIELESMYSVEFKGKKYKSKTELAEDYNIELSVFLGRLSIGWTVEEALGLKAPPNSLFYRGHRYKNLMHLCESKGKNYIKVKGRLNLGWSLEQALDDEPRKEKYVVDGVGFDTLEDVSKHMGVSKQAVSARLKRHGSLDKKRKRNTVKRKKPDKFKYTVNGKKFRSIQEVADFYGTKPHVLNYRLNKGFTLEQSVDKDFNAKYGSKRGRPRKE